MAGTADWRELDGALCAWFDAPSCAAGADLVRRAVDAAGARLLGAELRPTGVRLRLERPAGTPADDDVAASLSRAARDLGLTADPAGLQVLHLVVDTPDPDALLPFWRATTGYGTVGARRLEDPDRRWPRVTLRTVAEPRPLRGRTHVDVVRPAAAVDAARSATGLRPSGPYGLALADPDGNEVDLVPGDRLGDGPATSDWLALFGAVARYPADAAAAADLVVAVARLADEAGFPLLVDVRPDGVTLDSGKDRWEDETSGGGRFLELAARAQAAARGLGLLARTDGARFLQLGVDAVDVPASRAFWAGALGYRIDGREGVGDVHDPRWLGPVVMVQAMDAGDEERLRQPDRVRPELHVPVEELDARTDAVLAAGGRALREQPGRRTLADPEGHELELVTGT